MESSFKNICWKALHHIPAFSLILFLTEFSFRTVQRYLDEEDEANVIEDGIPESVAQLPCPNDELRATMLQEFLIIDHKYRETLVDLDAVYLAIVKWENSIQSLNILLSFFSAMRMVVGMRTSTNY
jgi:hypothetical protein